MEKYPLLNNFLTKKNNKKMKKSVFILTILSIILTQQSCMSRIDQGHVGLKIDLAGGNKGKGVTEVSGWVGYIPWLTTVEEFPVFTQTADYEDFVVTTKDAAQFHVDPTLNYSVVTEQVAHVYQQYRKPLPELEKTIIRNIVYDAYRITANSYTSDSIMANRGKFENTVEALLTKTLQEDGFKFERITSNLAPPQSLQDVINAKNTAVQQALKAENEVKTAEANAKIAVAKANGEAQAQIAQSKGNYESAKFDAMADRERQSAWTENYVKVKYLETWDGKLPQYILGSNTTMMMQMPK